MIIPGAAPLTDASEDLATSNLTTFLDAVRERAAELDDVPIRRRVAGISGDPTRSPGLDRDGRFAWHIPFTDSRTATVLMPGVALTLLREDLSSHAPILYVNDLPLWWNAAVGSVASEGMVLNLPTNP